MKMANFYLPENGQSSESSKKNRFGSFWSSSGGSKGKIPGYASPGQGGGPRVVVLEVETGSPADRAGLKRYVVYNGSV